ncbi:MAG: ABC transporter ATP-binding protein [Proteobacteria bacterium]|nr:ABC transporter ATP-binding protein [Pseudomonadota bacterium]MBU1716721.1 ABC transporter ATP-binding protein [Pseudomonadota bacterium]
MAATNKEQTIALEASGLVKLYKGCGRPALDGFSIVIREGDIFGLLGPNGAGKTTAISIMSSLLRASRGTVMIFGADTRRQADKVKEMIGLVPQEIALYRQLTARENLRYFGKLYGIKGRALGSRIDECLDFVGLLPKADQLVETYSGGMKRRVNLAVGILHQPKLLFLDEPTVGIDAQSRDMILARLAALNQAGTTMVYTTHYMEEAERLCSEVAIMDSGRVLSQGKPGELMKDGGHDTLQDMFFSLTGRKLRD